MGTPAVAIVEKHDGQGQKARPYHWPEGGDRPGQAGPRPRPHTTEDGMTNRKTYTKTNNRGHVRAEQGRGACLACGAPPSSSGDCPARTSSRFRSPERRTLDINHAAGRPDSWG